MENYNFKSKLFAGQNPIYRPLTSEEISGRKFYIVMEDKKVHALKIEKIVLKLRFNQSNVINTFEMSGVLTAFSENMTFYCLVAMTGGNKQMSINLGGAAKRFYDNYKDAAEGNENTVRFSCKCPIGDCITEAFQNSSMADYLVVKQFGGCYEWGYWVWDGLKPVFKYINLVDSREIYLDSEGWKFVNEPDWDEIDWDNAYATAEECKASNSIEIIDFP